MKVPIFVLLLLPPPEVLLEPVLVFPELCNEPKTNSNQLANQFTNHN
jgi:hypothetical protein